MDAILDHLRKELEACGPKVHDLRFRVNTMGQVCGNGWSVWYRFGRNKQGKFVDCYSAPHDQ